MRRLVVLGIAAIVTGLIVGVVVASSGDDGGGGKSSQSVPDLAPLPGSSDLGSRTRSDRTSTQETTTNDSGGTSAPDAPPATGGGDSGGTPAPDDSPQNDTPPPSGSPAERFEQFCQENPGAC
jgi:hypothetical protein